MVTVAPTRIALGTAIGLVLLPVAVSGVEIFRSSSAPASTPEARSAIVAAATASTANEAVPVAPVQPTRIAASGKKPATGASHPPKPTEEKPTATPSAESATSGVPPAPVLLALLRGTLVSVNQANITGNYSVLRDLGSPTFRERYTVAELAEQFRSWRAQSLDFAAVLLLDAKLSRPPEIESVGALHLIGFFPTSPLRIGFDLRFEPVNGHWRLATLSLDARPASGDAALPAARGPQGPAPSPSVQMPATSGAPLKAVNPAMPTPIANRSTPPGATLIAPLPGPAASAAAAEEAAARQAASAAAASAPPALRNTDAPPLQIESSTALAPGTAAAQTAAAVPSSGGATAVPAPFQMRRETDLSTPAPTGP
ncbi:hypothetical protein MWN34_09775 [Ancylobacter sp. 6x-1]|uniref:Uncharacterized protein n=1 Tax=Ancylobacter crimeensis TaxID=2579147 RepID=A0ABT0DB66_9HYPH|nr:hypothetical protein [Ancylobacter crimeensis]MCK0197200.1 hypothetical protein [Ancylobacter crimeensis]